MTLVRARILAALCGLFVAAAGTARAESLASIPNPRVQNGTSVIDTTATLTPELVAMLNGHIAEFERDTGSEMAVVIIRSLDGLTIEEASEKLFRMWGIGKKTQDNGLLFLWSTGDRRVRVEVGYGLEGALPDGKVGAILDQYVIARFKENRFDMGVMEGVFALITAARKEPLALTSPATETYDSTGWPLWLEGLGLIPFGIAAFVGYRKWRRLHPRRCPQCRTFMTRLDEIADDEHLSKGQVAEENVDSVDYDVWQCRSCSHQITLRYPKLLSDYLKCEQCHNRTVQRSSETIEAATTVSTGSERITEKCGFCDYTHEYTKTLPIKAESSSSSSGGSGWSSSDSSSSSDSGSFGGGSSGGGGASRGY